MGQLLHLEEERLLRKWENIGAWLCDRLDCSEMNVSGMLEVEQAHHDVTVTLRIKFKGKVYECGWATTLLMLREFEEGGRALEMLPVVSIVEQLNRKITKAFGVEAGCLQVRGI